MKLLSNTMSEAITEIASQKANGYPVMKLDLEWSISGVDAFTAPRIHELTTLRDYKNGAYDTTTMIIDISVYDYQTKLYPRKNMLYCSLTRTPCTVRGVSTTSAVEARYYKVILLTLEDHELFDQSTAGTTDSEKINATMQIGIQLIEEPLYKSMYSRMAGVFGPGVIEDYLYYLMSNRGELKCSIHPPDNVTDVEDVILPEKNIDLIDIANWLQREGPGIYNHGINTYFQTDMMYVYPVALLDTHEYRRKIVVYRAGNQSGISSDHGHAIIDGQLKIISAGDIEVAPGESRVVDERELLEQVHGNAIRWNSPLYQSNIINQENNTPRFTSKGASLYGMSDVDLKITRVHKLHTVNGFNQKSIINKTIGRVITIPWVGGKIDLIEPGTEVTYVYMVGDGMKYTTGIVEGTSERLSPVDGRPSENLFNVQTVLRLRVT